MDYEVLDPSEPLKYHDADECGKCTYVASADAIYISKDKLEKASFSPTELLLVSLGLKNPDSKLVDLGVFTLPRWVGHDNFYLFQCLECENISVDYAHGYTSDGLRNGFLFLSCKNDECGCRLIVRQKKVYKRGSLEAPGSDWTYLFSLFKEIRGIKKQSAP